MVRCEDLYAGAFDRVEARTSPKVPQRFHPKLLNEKKARALAELAQFRHELLLVGQSRSISARIRRRSRRDHSSSGLFFIS